MLKVLNHDSARSFINYANKYKFSHFKVGPRVYLTCINLFFWRGLKYSCNSLAWLWYHCLEVHGVRSDELGWCPERSRAKEEN